MYMNKFSIIYEILLISIILVVIDTGYLYSMKNFFNNQIKLVQGTDIQMNIYAAILCYVVLVYGLYYFIIKDKRPLIDAFIFGIVIYAVYELTTMALLKNWSWKTVALDTLWGGILFTITTYLVYAIQKYI
jgi:uncharacterized membrane protein